MMIPPAAQLTSHGWIRVSPGRTSPTAASSSAMLEEELKPSWQRRVHLGGNRGRGRDHHRAVSKERNREQHLKHPEHDIHDRFPPP